MKMKWLLIAAILGRGFCYGQESRATILGRLTDSSGAVISGARIEAVNVATNAGVSSITNQEGNYQMPYLLPGIYRVTAEQAGFKKAVRDMIELRVNDRMTLDFKLDLGNIAESIVVTGETPLLESGNASVGMTLDQRRLSELPVLGGNAFFLGHLAPGVASPNNTGRSAGHPTDWTTLNGMTVTGTRGGSSEVTLDGAPDMWGTNTAFAPPQDLVQEFKMEITNYDASAGHTAGASANVSTKSGTNTLHGTGFFTDSRIHAMPWFSNNFIYDPTTGPITEQKKESVSTGWLLQHWSGTMLGPVWIPHVYNGRNRTFFAAGFEMVRLQNWLSSGASTVPTPEEANGDFSTLLKLGSQYQIYDPSTTAPAANGRFSRQPLPGNIVPQSRIDPIARKILGYWPAPNQAGTADQRQNLFSLTDKRQFYVGSLARLDHNLSENHRVFFRLNQNDSEVRVQNMPTDASGTVTNTRGWGTVLDDVYVLNPQLLLNLRYGLTLVRQAVSNFSQGFDLLSLGLPSNVVNQIRSLNNPAGIAFPSVAVDGLTALGGGGGNSHSNYYQTWAGTLTKIAGNHSVRTGGEFRLMRHNWYNFGYVAPSFVFSSTYTKGPVDNSPAAPIGQGLASMLLGIPTGGGVDINSSTAEQSTFSALFVQDDWKLTPRLTINLGLRYEYEGPTTERYNRSLRGFDFQTPSPIEAQAKANYAKAPFPEVPVSSFRALGGLLFAGVNGQPRGLRSPDRNNFAPRVGMAYQLAKKTVLRAGYGIFYDQLGIDRQGVNQSGGFNQSTSLIPSVDNGLTFVGTLSNPFPNGFQLPLGAAGGLRTQLGRAASYFYGNSLNPYMQRWSFSVQQELPKRVLMQITYIGNRGTKLASSVQQDPVPREYLSTSPVRDQVVINSLTQQVANPFAGIADFAGTNSYNATIAKSRLLTAYPQFTGITTNIPTGFSWYHSMQLQVERRLAQGFTLQAGYTWSKFMQATGFLNDTDVRQEKVISDQDYPQRFTISGIAELPVGKGKPLLGKPGRLLNAFIGGWQLQGLYTGQSGNALGFGNAIFSGTLHDIPLPVSQRKVQRWFNAAGGFQRNSTLQLANNIQTLSTRFNNVRSDGLNNFDLSAFKTFPVTEKVKAQFRMEAYNALNHAQFLNPNTNPASTAFGTVTGEQGMGQRHVQFTLKFMF